MPPVTEFRVLPQSQLLEPAFDVYPVWSEHYDFDEIDDIERWGLDRSRVLHLFKENSLGNEHCVYTLLETNPFPERMRIFVRAKITTVEGAVLKGFVMNEDAFCLTIFCAGEQFVFSRHPMLESENRKHESQLLKAIGGIPNVFPVRYETDFNGRRGARIAGEFMYGTRKS